MFNFCLKSVNVFSDLPSVDVESIKEKFSALNVSFVLRRDIPGQDGQFALYFSTQTISKVSFYIELKFKAGFNVCKVTVKSENKALSEHFKKEFASVLLMK
jgi:hypothetical protein